MGAPGPRVTKRRSREIREKVIDLNPGSTVRLGPLTVTFVYAHRGHQVVWIDYAGRVSEIDLGPRGARVIA